MPFRRSPVNLPCRYRPGRRSRSSWPSACGAGWSCRPPRWPPWRWPRGRSPGRRGRRGGAARRGGAVRRGGRGRRDVGRALHRLAVHGPHRPVVRVEACGDVVGAAWHQAAGEVVFDGAQRGDGAAVEVEQCDAAAGQGPGPRSGGREVEVVDAQAHVPAVVGVRLDLDRDLGRVLLVDLTVVPSLLVRPVQESAHGRGRHPLPSPVPVTGAAARRSAEQDADRERGEQSTLPRHAGESRTTVRRPDPPEVGFSARAASPGSYVAPAPRPRAAAVAGPERCRERPLAHGDVESYGDA